MATVYRTVNTSFWTDPKVRALAPDGKLLMLYLVTCPHAHVGGIYYLPEVTVLHETGVTRRALDTLWHTLSKPGLAFRDGETEVVWVTNMLRYQGSGSKIFASVANQLACLHNSPLINKFLQRYPEIAPLYSDRVSKGHQRQSEFGNPDMDMDQDNEQENEEYSCGEADKAASSPLVTFPCSGKTSEPREWFLTESHVAEWSEAYPGVDILSESRRALAWVKADLSRRKTAKGMARFLTGWLSRSQNSGRRPQVDGGHSAPQRPMIDPGIFGGGNDET